ncbi:hypothetical protein [Paenibacillus protaetiae]|uniref:Uncharacterized protein n=1 Tax=Paenibacillus protaetiae TaxID=2509456 RepID=A0A4P6EW01_9BACL|nr:hypothetical protein [Paenibacillus protaetiae]QAY66353.1 hypothetical protein ET464_07980 [Paenibacillus protaetiae]
MSSLTRSVTEEYEMLIRNIAPITDLLQKSERNPSGWSIKKTHAEELPEHICEGGVYAFWWIKTEESMAIMKNRTKCYTVKGKKIKEDVGHHEVTIEFTDQWLEYSGQQKEGYIPLYVGKNDACILERLEKHLRIPQLKYQRTTSKTDQLRRGIERIFSKDERTLILSSATSGISLYLCTVLMKS